MFLFFGRSCSGNGNIEKVTENGNPSQLQAANILPPLPTITTMITTTTKSPKMGEEDKAIANKIEDMMISDASSRAKKFNEGWSPTLYT